MFKLLPAALAALLATSGLASAASNTVATQGQIFSNSVSERGHSDTRVAFGRVDAPAAGVIEVYEVRAGQTGRLVATKAVHAGTNWDVRIPVGLRRSTDLLAVLKVNGAVVDQQFVGDSN